MRKKRLEVLLDVNNHDIFDCYVNWINKYFLKLLITLKKNTFGLKKVVCHEVCKSILCGPQEVSLKSGSKLRTQVFCYEHVFLTIAPRF